MRYYKIVITDQNGKLYQTASSIPGSDSTYTSYANNQTLPGALQIELDIPLAPYATPMGGAIVRIWGITLGEIAQAALLNPQYGANGPTKYFNIAIYGGMQKGLPLANSGQNGILVQGTIYQAFGNWIGSDMTLDLILNSPFGTNASPLNFSFNWLKNTSLKNAIMATLTTAFTNVTPKYKISINISDKLVLSYDQPGYYKTLPQFATYLKQVSANIIGGTYTGVDIFINNDTIVVDDRTTQHSPQPIAFQDLIGQPTWIQSEDGLQIQFKCVMRADLSISDYIRMPKAIVTTTSGAASSLINLKSAFEGVFQITQIRHVGNFRQPDAASWVSTFNAVPLTIQPTGQSATTANV